MAAVSGKSPMWLQRKWRRDAELAARRPSRPVDAPDAPAPRSEPEQPETAPETPAPRPKRPRDPDRKQFAERPADWDDGESIGRMRF